MNISPAFLGLIRGLGYPILMLIFSYFSVAEHLTSLGISLTGATIMVGIIGLLEHGIEAYTGKAMFGAVTTD